MNEWFGSVSSKSTKFGTDVVHTMLNEIWVDAKLDFSRNGRIREIQYGRHPGKKMLEKNEIHILKKSA